MEIKMNALTQETKTLLTLLNLPRVGVVTVRNIAVNLKVHDWDITTLIEKRIIPDITDEQHNIAHKKVDQILEACCIHGISVISLVDAGYPPLLKKIKDAPPILYFKGSLSSLQSKCAAVVGTRKASDAGIKIAEKIAQTLTEYGFTVVSGLALGIDTAAHKGAIKSSGITIAILAHGLHTVAPSSNKELALEISESGGALISEHPPGFPARPPEFVRRNRIQSGMSQFSVIVETGEVGGTIHQAKFTKDQGKEVYVIIPPRDNQIYTQFNSSGGLMIAEKMGGIKVSSTQELIRLVHIEPKPGECNLEKSDLKPMDQLGFDF